jgi:hypothetical protein
MADDQNLSEPALVQYRRVLVPALGGLHTELSTETVHNITLMRVKNNHLKTDGCVCHLRRAALSP